MQEENKTKHKKNLNTFTYFAQCVARVWLGASIRVDARGAGRLRNVVGTVDRFAAAALGFVARRRRVPTNDAVRNKRDLVIKRYCSLSLSPVLSISLRR